MFYISEKEAQKLQDKFLQENNSNAQETYFAETIKFIDYQPNFISLKTKASQSRFLILSDNYYPGWKAYVNGMEKPVLKVYYTFRGLLLDKGENDVIFVFKPQSLIIGAYISLLTLMGIIANILLLRKK